MDSALGVKEMSAQSGGGGDGGALPGLLCAAQTVGPPAALACVGALFLREKLSPALEAASGKPATAAARAAFVATFACATDLLTLVLYEVTGTLPPHARAVAWRLHVSLLLVLLAGALPAAHAFLALRLEGVRTTRALAGAAIATLGCLASLLAVGWYFPTPDGPLISTAQAVSRLSVVGVLLLAVLSGFGAVNLPVQYLYRLKQRVSEIEVAAATARVRNCMESVAAKRRRAALARREERRVGALAQASRLNGGNGDSGGADGRLSKGGIFGSLRRVTKLVRGGARSAAARERASAEQLEREAVMLEDVSRTAFLELAELHEAHERTQQARSALGMVWTALLGIGALCCAGRVLLSMKNVLFGDSGQISDPVITLTRSLAAVGSLGGLQLSKEQAKAIAQWCSLALIGILTVLSLRRFAVTSMRVARLAGGTAAVRGVAGTTSLLLFVTEIMGLYFLSSVLLIRVNLRDDHRLAIEEAMGGDVPFEHFHRLFDKVFCVSAAFTALSLYTHHAANADDSPTLAHAQLSKAI